MMTGLAKVIQTIFFGICVLTDLSSLLTQGTNDQEQQRQLRKLIALRDWLMAVLAFPVGVMVVITFWALYSYDRELVYPKILDSFIPPWINHGMTMMSAPMGSILPLVLMNVLLLCSGEQLLTRGHTVLERFLTCLPKFYFQFDEFKFRFVSCTRMFIHASPRLQILHQLLGASSLVSPGSSQGWPKSTLRSAHFAKRSKEFPNRRGSRSVRT
ncbi:uncharacterized protein aig1 isoform X3 [Scyliorhinus canicula]|uniref:uncharacterized protein aig1 isoform X3 n=1 Tax=Scyliorhinus canicula TaxID=7830 RepID=UPI0018F4AEAD|nr:uncharacterized protein aig1 isoform X3 [Scyliorhinus canicula]